MFNLHISVKYELLAHLSCKEAKAQRAASK